MNETSKMALAAVGSAILAWAGFAARRAVKNWGKTSLEIANDKLEDAVKDHERARETPDPDDDKATEAAVREAKRSVELMRRLGAITDAVGDTDPPSK